MYSTVGKILLHIYIEVRAFDCPAYVTELVANILELLTKAAVL